MNKDPSGSGSASLEKSLERQCHEIITWNQKSRDAFFLSYFCTTATASGCVCWTRIATHLAMLARPCLWIDPPEQDMCLRYCKRAFKKHYFQQKFKFLAQSTSFLIMSPVVRTKNL
jgi:hypothetical protein